MLIGIAAMSHETNTFSPVVTDLARFSGRGGEPPESASLSWPMGSGPSSSCAATTQPVVAAMAVRATTERARWNVDWLIESS